MKSAPSLYSCVSILLFAALSSLPLGAQQLTGQSPEPSKMAPAPCSWAQYQGCQLDYESCH
jgi:hypothetical protein